jgi:dihydroorotase
VADITIFDPAAQWTVDPALFLSKCRNSPYRGKHLTGRATCTIVGGRIVFAQDDVGQRNADVGA